jgi:RNA polymerase sigma factor (sigma-70 family)
MSPEAERAALEAVERIGPRLHGILAWFRIPYEDAEELRQEAMLALVRCWERIDCPEGWLIGTMFRLCRRYKRRRRERGWLQPVEEWLLEAWAPLREPEQKRFEVLRDLTAVLRQLEERERILLKLRLLGLTCDEVAERLGCRPSSVGKMTSRALAEARRVARRLKKTPHPSSRRPVVNLDGPL